MKHDCCLWRGQHDIDLTSEERLRLISISIPAALSQSIIGKFNLDCYTKSNNCNVVFGWPVPAAATFPYFSFTTCSAAFICLLSFTWATKWQVNGYYTKFYLHSVGLALSRSNGSRCLKLIWPESLWLWSTLRHGNGWSHTKTVSKTQIVTNDIKLPWLRFEHLNAILGISCACHAISAYLIIGNERASSEPNKTPVEQCGAKPASTAGPKWHVDVDAKGQRTLCLTSHWRNWLSLFDRDQIAPSKADFVYSSSARRIRW